MSRAPSRGVGGSRLKCGPWSCAVPTEELPAVLSGEWSVLLVLERLVVMLLDVNYMVVRYL